MIVDQIVEKTKQRVQKQKEQITLEQIKQQALLLPKSDKRPFEKALAKKGMSFILEVKKASPSKGIIAKEFPYIEIAKEYQEIGASAISVLTEPDFFMGDGQYLKEIANVVTIPVLRKDFIIDEYMIYEAKIWGASAILLICSILKPEQLKEHLILADTLGMSCLVEAHSEKEIEMALSAGAKVIGVNNRDLRDFSVDVGHSATLRTLVPKEILFVSESGISEAKHIEQLLEYDVNAVLIGETIMRAENKLEALQKLQGRHNEN